MVSQSGLVSFLRTLAKMPLGIFWASMPVRSMLTWTVWHLGPRGVVVEVVVVMLLVARVALVAVDAIVVCIAS